MAQYDMRRFFIPPSPDAETEIQYIPPDSERDLAHDMYKELVEIKSGHTAGVTTSVLT
jgi:hypothetical protein